MIYAEDVTVTFGEAPLFDEVNLKFLKGNCYGLIGANGAGKSTFLKVLSGELESTKGSVRIDEGKRMAVLKQDQFAYDEHKVLDTVLMGYEELYKVYAERDYLYSKDEMTEDEGMRVADLENIFGEMDGYSAEADAATMLSDLGITEDDHEKLMGDLETEKKVRVLLAQALFGNPDILLLDEPTNQLDYHTVLWLEKFLLDFENTVIVVSHDRHFLNKVCTHIADIDYRKIKIFVGNYEFWKSSSELIQQQLRDQNKKKADKVKELEDFVRRFSANASKSKQATSRKKLIEKLRPEDLAVSTRRSPYIAFKANRPTGNAILKVKNLCYSVDGETLVNNVSFELEKKDKLAIVGKHTLSKLALLQLLAGEIEPDSGTIEWGETISKGYFPKDNSTYFDTEISLLDWLAQYTDLDDLQEIRGYLGRMLFSGEAVDKPVRVLSGGEKARAMFSKLMITADNLLIFDEPTNHLDLESITALNDGLKGFSECMIFTSHDFQLLNTVSNRVLELSPKGYLDKKMDFDDYMQSGSIQKEREALG